MHDRKGIQKRDKMFGKIVPIDFVSQTDCSEILALCSASFSNVCPAENDSPGPIRFKTGSSKCCPDRVIVIRKSIVDLDDMKLIV